MARKKGRLMTRKARDELQNSTKGTAHGPEKISELPDSHKVDDEADNDTIENARRDLIRIPASAGYTGFERWKTDDISTSFGYDTRSSSYVQSVRATQKEGFKLVPLTFTEGPHKGRHVLMLEPIVDYFRFMDLPPELRTRVYDFLLGSDLAMFASRDKSRIPRGEPRPARRLRYRRGLHEYSSDKKPVMTGHAMLAVSKRVTAEIVPMLYGAATFNFDTTNDLRDFLSDIGSMVSNLRHVRLRQGALRTASFRPACTALKNANNLCSLTIEYRINTSDGSIWVHDKYDHTIGSIKDLAPDLLPFVRTQHAIRKVNRSLSDFFKTKKASDSGYPEAVEIVCVKRYKCSGCMVNRKGGKCPVTACTGETRAVAAKEEEELTLLLRKELARLLWR